MEERKKMGVFGRILLILLILILLALCFLSAVGNDLTLGVGPWGVYRTDDTSEYLSSAYMSATTDDLLVTRRDAAPQDGALVTYWKENGVRAVDLYDDLLGHAVLDTEAKADPEPVLFILQGGGKVMEVLSGLRWYFWGGTAGLIVVLIVGKVTSRSRWRKRQQKKMLANFNAYGEKYENEDNDMDY